MYFLDGIYAGLMVTSVTTIDMLIYHVRIPIKVICKSSQEHGPSHNFPYLILLCWRTYWENSFDLMEIKLHLTFILRILVDGSWNHQTDSKKYIVTSPYVKGSNPYSFHIHTYIITWELSQRNEQTVIPKWTRWKHSWKTHFQKSLMNEKLAICWATLRS